MSKGYVFGAAGLVAVAAAALLLGRCGGSSEPPHEPRSESEPAAAERSAAADFVADDSKASPLSTSAPSAVRGDEPAIADGSATPSSDGGGDAAPPSSAATRINAALARDPKDLALYARIERELKRAPPPAVNTIVEARANGGGREQLLAHAQRLFADDFQLRALVIRWIDEVAPAPGSTTKAPATPGGSPSGPTHVKPILKK